MLAALDGFADWSSNMIVKSSGLPQYMTCYVVMLARYGFHAQPGVSGCEAQFAFVQTFISHECSHAEYLPSRILKETPCSFCSGASQLHPTCI